MKNETLFYFIINFCFIPTPFFSFKGSVFFVSLLLSSFIFLVETTPEGSLMPVAFSARTLKEYVNPGVKLSTKQVNCSTFEAYEAHAYDFAVLYSII